jgi:hypothetical protein
MPLEADEAFAIATSIAATITLYEDGVTKAQMPKLAGDCRSLCRAPGERALERELFWMFHPIGWGLVSGRHTGRGSGRRRKHHGPRVGNVLVAASV